MHIVDYVILGLLLLLSMGVGRVAIYTSKLKNKMKHQIRLVKHHLLYCQVFEPP